MFSAIRRTNFTSSFLNLTSYSIVEQNVTRTINTTSCVFAARKGIRIARMRALLARAMQRKSSKQVKQPWVNPKFRLDKNLTSMTKRYTDIGKLELPKDDVYFMDGFKEVSYQIEEAIDLHREVLDPTVLNDPNALLYAKVEMNLRLKKKTKFLKGITGVYRYPNDYEFKRTNRVVAVCRNDDEIEMCNKAGAMLSGSQDILKLIKAKELKEVEYDYIVCHSDMLLQLAESKKYLADRFPGTALNNFGGDMQKLINRFVNGITYKMEGDVVEEDYGFIQAHFGRAKMSNEQLKENLLGFLKEIQKFKPTDTEHPLITRVLILAPPNDERFKIRHWEYLDHEDPFISELKRYEQAKKDEEETKRKAEKKNIKKKKKI